MAKYVESLHVGIDLGTTTSTVAILENDGASIRLLDIATSSDSTKTQSQKLFRSAVNVKHGLVGPDADTDAVRSTTYFDLKKKFIEDAHQVINEQGKGRITPYKYQLEILNAMYENSMRVLSEGNDTELKLESVTVTVPTDFKTAHRELMLNLIKESKWGVSMKVNVVDEPIAASMAKLHADPTDGNGHWVTYDLGGGTFDASLLESFEVEGTMVQKVHINRGDLDLGGFQFDEAIWNLTLASIDEKDVVERINSDKKFAEEFKTAFVDNCGDIKMMLDHSSEYDDVLKVKMENYGVEIITVTIKREDYWNAILPLIDKTVAMTKEIMDFAQMEKIKVQGINFVGGSTKDPILRKYVKSALGLKKAYFNKPEEMVSMGGALHAGIQAGGMEKIKAAILDTISSPIGMTLADGTILWVVNEGDPLPITKEHTVSGVSVGQTSVAFSFVEASKLYYGLDQLQGNFFVSREQAVRGFKRTYGIPEFTFQVHVDENKIAHIQIVQSETGVIQKINNIDIFNQKDQKSVQGRLENLMHDAIIFAEKENAPFTRGQDIATFLEASLERLANAVSARPELASANDLRAIAKGATEALESGNRAVMELWLHRVLSKAGIN